MKKKIGFITMTLLIGIVISCGKEFLDTVPQGAVGDKTLTSSESGADALLIAAYSNLDGFSGWDNGTPWGGASSNWSFGSVAGGDAYKGSEANDQPDVTPIERHETNANNPYVEGKWRNYYDGISRANKAIKTFKELPKEALPDARRATKIAEATFLRGLYHFELRKIFGRIPFITEDLADVRVGNAEDALPKIQADFISAAANLPVNQTDIGRITKGVAQSFLGITYMWEKKYAEAKIQFDAVISSGKYALNPNFSDNFDAASKNSKEGILEVQQSVNDGTTDNGNNGDVLNFPYSGGPGGCCGFHQPSQNLVNAFRTDAGGLPFLDTYNAVDVKNDQGLKATDPFTPETAPLDPRLDWTVGRRGIPYLDWGKHPGVSWIRDQLYAGPYSPLKNVYYKSQEGTLSTASGWTKGYNANNTKLLRYADLLLYAAEAEVELGNLTVALGYVNQIRNRAKNGKYVMDGTNPAANYVINPYASFPDANFARKAVRFERRLELGMEGHRFFDLVRWGIAEQEKNAYFAVERTKRTYLNGARFITGKSEVYPIPQKAITQSSKDGVATIKQNPNY